MVARFKSNGNGHANGHSVESKGRGRPTKYQGIYPRQAEKLCLLGATDAELADFFQITLPTLYQWQVMHHDFSKSIKIGKEPANDRTVRSLYMRANGFWVDTEKLFVLTDKEFDEDGKLIKMTQRVHHEPTKEYYPPDVGALAWWQKNRMSSEWRDKHEIEGTIRNEHVFTFNIFENDLGANAKVIEGNKQQRRP